MVRFAVLTMVLLTCGGCGARDTKTSAAPPPADPVLTTSAIRQPKPASYESEIVDMVRSTQARVIDAIRSEDLGKLRAAKAALQDAAQSVYRYELAAQRDGKTEEQINHFLENDAKWNDCYMLTRNVNDLIVRLMN